MRLLVSVRSRGEAESAVAGGVDIVDAKEPSAGALGCVSMTTFAAIAAASATRPVTAALGDAELEDAVESSARAFTRAGAEFVKIGFAGVDREARLGPLLAAAVRGASTERGSVVAVAYADFDDVGALPPALITSAAALAGARGVLLDTAGKGGPGLLQLMSPVTIEAFVRHVHSGGMFAALAGQLQAADFDTVRSCGADIAGVRGAACAGGRNETVSESKVAALASALRASRRHISPPEDLAAILGQSTDRRWPGLPLLRT